MIPESLLDVKSLSFFERVYMNRPRYVLLTITFLCILTFATVAAASNDYGILETNITLNVMTDKLEYILRDDVTVNGTVMNNSSPMSNMLVAIEIIGPIGFKLAYRTATIGNPDEVWPLKIEEIFIKDLDYNPINTVKIGNLVFFGATVRNKEIFSISNIYITLTVCDASGIIIDAFQLYEGSINANTSISAARTVYIPTWATPGIAKVYCNVYDREPKDIGIPWLPEVIGEYQISRTDQGMFNGGIPLSNGTSHPPGIYEASLKLSPQPYPGTYQVYAVGGYSPTIRPWNTTTFNVLDTESPPQASFTYSPLEPYPNQTVTFDGSSSSAEGYGDVIIRYEWDFGDGSPPVIKTGNATHPPDPTATHMYSTWGDFVVTLNVTDTEGYWSTTSKPISVKSPYPTANFTWSPQKGFINGTMTFNASNSLLGWDVSKQEPAPIINYTWDFGDGNVTTTANPVITHVYTNPGNYTVMLTIKDSVNQTDSISYIIEIQNKTSPPWDVNNDGKCDIRDIAFVAAHYGELEGDPNWDPVADINDDGKVDIRDIAAVAAHYGEIY